jgi:hypothetical protein
LRKRFGLWPTDAKAEAKALSLIGFFAACILTNPGTAGYRGVP